MPRWAFDPILMHFSRSRRQFSTNRSELISASLVDVASVLSSRQPIAMKPRQLWLTLFFSMSCYLSKRLLGKKCPNISSLVNFSVTFIVCCKVSFERDYA